MIDFEWFYSKTGFKSHNHVVVGVLTKTPLRVAMGQAFTDTKNKQKKSP